MFSKLIIFFSFLVSFVSFSQENWTLYKSVNGVNIYQKEADCRPEDNLAQKVVLFKIENNTNSEITINWTLRVWYNDKEMVNKSNPEQRNYSFIVNANSSIEGDCSQLSNTKNLYLYKKFLDFEKSKVLTHFEFENIKVITK